MRKTILFNTLLLVSMFVFVQVLPAQVEVQSGTATYGVPGAYALPFSPLVSTPSVSLENPPLQVGASNATGENVAGATNSTLSIAASEGTYASYEESASSSEASNMQSKLNLGAAEFEGNQSVAVLMAEEHLPKIAKGSARLYTNQDIEQASGTNQTTQSAAHQYTNQDAEQAREHTDQNAGTVNLNGKVERLP